MSKIPARKMIQKLFGALLVIAVVMAVALLLAPARHIYADSVSWVETPASDLKTGDVVVIADKTSGRALSSANGTASAPTAAAISLNSDKTAITGEVADDLRFTVTVSGGVYTFSVGEDALYCTNSNNGVRIGENSATAFSIQEDFLYHNGTKRYLGVYSNKDWRCYTTIHANIKSTVLAFYKLTAADTPDTPDAVTVSYDGNGAQGSMEATEGIVAECGFTAPQGKQFKEWNTQADGSGESFAAGAQVTESVLLYAVWEDIPGQGGGQEDHSHDLNAGQVSDSLNNQSIGVSGTNYVTWKDLGYESGAVYAGQSAGGNSSIQLRSNGSNSGIVTTTSGGKVKKITVVWNSHTAIGRVLNVYGSNTAYTAPTDLYDSSKAGTLLGTIVYGSGTELTIDGDYAYIGIRSASGALYLDSVTIAWEGGSSAQTETKTENEVKPTCTADGSYDLVVYCTICKQELARETVVVKTNGHTYGAWIAEIPATYESEGALGH